MLVITLHGNPHIHEQPYIICLPPHSCRISHYMCPHSFMPQRTLYVRSHIHVGIHIICLLAHSWVRPHYMYAVTFMALLTFHGSTNIHVLRNITWLHVHSCLRQHYMDVHTFITNSLTKEVNKCIGSWNSTHCMLYATFMRNLTLHASANIHQLNPKLGV